MTQKLLGASARVASLAMHQPRVAIGGLGLGAIAVVDLVATMLAAHSWP